MHKKYNKNRVSDHLQWNELLLFFSVETEPSILSVAKYRKMQKMIGETNFRML